MTLFCRLVILIAILSTSSIVILNHQVKTLSESALEEEALSRLTAVAASRKGELERYLSYLERTLEQQSKAPYIDDAVQAFTREYQLLDNPQFELQREYITNNPYNADQRDRLQAAPIEGRYHIEHQKYHPMLNDWLKAVGLYDVFLIDPEGNVVYTVFKERDFATNLVSGNWKDSGLAQVAQPILADPIPGSVSFVDFAPYKPSDEAPASFAAKPIFSPIEGFVGIIAIQLPIDTLNGIVQRIDGKGDSGETFLVNEHNLMLTDSRFFEESTILKQRVDNDSVSQGHKGINGHTVIADYRGVDVFSVHTFIDPFGAAFNSDARWALLTEIDVSEIREPSKALTIRVFAVGFIIIFASIIAGGIVASNISKPLRRIQLALTDVMEGKAVEIPGQGRADEVGKLAAAAESFRSLIVYSQMQEMMAELSQQLSSGVTYYQAPQICIDYICQRLELPLGSFYLYDLSKESYVLHASVGVDRRSQVRTEFSIEEGMVGQCAREGKPIHLSPVPEGFAAIETGVGQASVYELMLYPVEHQGEAIAILEFGLLEPSTQEQKTSLTKLVETLGLMLANLKSSEESARLLKETQQQAETLEKSQRDLAKVNTELTSQTEELKSQTEELRATEEELRAQQEALNTKNVELEKRSLELAESKRDTEEKAKEVEKASQYKSEFLANMSHELRTPLNSILILSKDLSENEECRLGEDEIESAKIIHESGSNLLCLINDILDLSKIEAGKLDIHTETFDINDLALYLRKVFKPLADDKQIQFDVNNHTELGMFASDYHRLIQILTNILSNAVKFTEVGGVTLNLTQTPSQLVAEIIDTGIGIDEDKIEHIFGAFNQADGATTRKFGGTGLGLTITKRLVELLGGDITVTSEVGKGSRFIVSIKNHQQSLKSVASSVNRTQLLEGDNQPLPYENSRSPSLVVEQPKSNPKSAQSTLGKLMVVEDDARLVRILERLLDGMGYDAQFANSAEAALALIEQNNPSGILLDLGLPNMSGMEMLSALKAEPKHKDIPVYIMSGAEDTGEASRKGALGYLHKPVTKEAIKKAITVIENNAQKIVKPKVLILEDDDVTAKALIKHLENDEIDLTVLPNGEQGLIELKQAHWQAVILDITLDDMNGFDWLLRAKGEIEHLPPVLVHSARDLTQEEYLELREITDMIVVKGPQSQQRLREELLSVIDSIHEADEKQAAGVHESKNDEAGSEASSKTKEGIENVLLVDDDPRNLFALSKVLRSKGYKVTLANSGQKAIDLMQMNNYDCLLSDIMMPEMDGYELIARVRNSGLADLPIIALTAKAMPGDLEKCLEAGANDYLSKPVDVEKLVGKLNQWK